MILNEIKGALTRVRHPNRSNFFGAGWTEPIIFDFQAKNFRAEPILKTCSGAESALPIPSSQALALTTVYFLKNILVESSVLYGFRWTRSLIQSEKLKNAFKINFCNKCSFYNNKKMIKVISSKDWNRSFCGLVCDKLPWRVRNGRIYSHAYALRKFFSFICFNIF